MSAPTPDAISDTLDSTTMGVHSGLPPRLLPKNQLSFAVNVTCRGGFPRTRPNYRKLKISYSGESTQTNLRGNFQKASFYEGFGSNQNCLVSAVAGRLFRWLIVNDQVSVSEITPLLGGNPATPDLNNPSLDKAWMWQAEDFLIVTDGQSLPVFFDGAGTRRSRGPSGQELPAGAAGSFINGRVILSLTNRRAYIAGDLVYNRTSGTPAYNYRDSVLRTTENEAILNGAAFAVPIQAGPINAIFAVAVPDTSLGQGPIQIGTRRGVFGVNLPLDSTLWTTTLQPSQVISLPSSGPLSDGVAIVNGDAWYRAKDGIRSFQIARRDFNTWVQTPLSYEVSRVLDVDTEALLDHSSSVDFRNRLLMTCSPYRVPDRGVAHRGLVSLDFNNISSLTTRTPPDYDGLWTGIPILQVLTGTFNGVERCFAFALDGDGDITLYEIMADDAARFDFDGTQDVRTESWFETNALFGLVAYPDAIKNRLKKLVTTELYPKSVSGTVDFDVKYRSDDYPLWRDWKSFSVCAESCIKNPCPDAGEVQELYFTYRRLPEPSDECNPITGRNYRSGYAFQLRVFWRGHSELNKVVTWARPINETLSNVCVDQDCVGLKQCGENLFDYSIE